MSLKQRRDHKPEPKMMPKHVRQDRTVCAICGDPIAQVYNGRLRVKTRVHWRHVRRWQRRPCGGCP